MEYSIQALARLAGVTTRTLRWYDQIGLLKPSRVADNGYRYYGPAEVDRLQDILYYRALGVALAQIRTCLDEPSFDRLAVLRSHLTALQGERARLEQLIRSVEATIGAMKPSNARPWPGTRRPTAGRPGTVTGTGRWTRPRRQSKPLPRTSTSNGSSWGRRSRGSWSRPSGLDAPPRGRKGRPLRPSTAAG